MFLIQTACKTSPSLLGFLAFSKTNLVATRFYSVWAEIHLHQPDKQKQTADHKLLLVVTETGLNCSDEQRHTATVEPVVILTFLKDSINSLKDRNTVFRRGTAVCSERKTS